MSWKDVWDGESKATKGQLLDYDRNFVIDFTRSAVRGALPNGNLAPLDLNAPTLFQGILEIDKGGTSADLSATGPGVLKQTSMGNVVTVGPIDYPEIDWTSGTALNGQALIFDIAGPSADFGKIALNNVDVVQGVLSPTFGGTGVNNGSFALTIPATGTAALLGLADQAFTENNSFAKLLRAHNVSGTNGYGLRIWDGTNDWATLQALDLSSNSFLFFALNRYWDGSAWQSFNTRVGASFQVTNDSFDFYTFPVSSNVPTSRFQVSNAGNVTHSGYFQGVEVTAPAAGAANSYRIFAVDSGAGKTILKVQFATGAAQTIATQP